MVGTALGAAVLVVIARLDRRPGWQAAPCVVILGQFCQETRQAVHDEAQEIKATLKDGSADVIAEKVKEKVEPVIREGDRRQDDMPIAGGRRRRDGRV